MNVETSADQAEILNLRLQKFQAAQKNSIQSDNLDLKKIQVDHHGQPGFFRRGGEGGGPNLATEGSSDIPLTSQQAELEENVSHMSLNIE